MAYLGSHCDCCSSSSSSSTACNPRRAMKQGRVHACMLAVKPVSIHPIYKVHCTHQLCSTAAATETCTGTTSLTRHMHMTATGRARGPAGSMRPPVPRGVRGMRCIESEGWPDCAGIKQLSKLSRVDWTAWIAQANDAHEPVDSPFIDPRLAWHMACMWYDVLRAWLACLLLLAALLQFCLRRAAEACCC